MAAKIDETAHFLNSVQWGNIEVVNPLPMPVCSYPKMRLKPPIKTPIKPPIKTPIKTPIQTPIKTPIKPPICTIICIQFPAPFGRAEFPEETFIKKLGMKNIHTTDIHRYTYY
jgi:hypothetical protein